MPSTSSALPSSTGYSRDELWTLYQAAIAERNFQLTINWDRTKFYFLFNAALFSVAGGLERIGTSFAAGAGIFGLTALHSLFAAYSIWKGHEYYRAARTQLKSVERDLGIIGEAGSPFAVKTTKGMVRATEGRLGIPLRDRVTITNINILLQVLIGVAATWALVNLITTR